MQSSRSSRPFTVKAGRPVALPSSAGSPAAIFGAAAKKTAPRISASSAIPISSAPTAKVAAASRAPTSWPPQSIKRGGSRPNISPYPAGGNIDRQRFGEEGTAQPRHGVAAPELVIE